MATKKKKTNFISYELEKLEKYWRSLEIRMDNNLPEDAEDRLDVRYSTNGNPIIKVIASQEAQVKQFYDILEKLPALLREINLLRSEVDGLNEEKPEQARGGLEIPLLFQRKLGAKKEEHEEEKFETINLDAEDADDEAAWANITGDTDSEGTDMTEERTAEEDSVEEEEVQQPEPEEEDNDNDW